ncbi:hypothetical protein TELCIR_18677 [Teladorsagia circumcincta]|uniref:Reverse transcriptase domain-containing protein n=1 Tax=Teladorsagia circumcincta TaxID=45464 RepID=A0A2G9TPH8_TELCI|nr:hypothetical protein TELCIR_18677 [Teladorsagia circumcincta]
MKRSPSRFGQGAPRLEVEEEEASRSSLNQVSTSTITVSNLPAATLEEGLPTKPQHDHYRSGVNDCFTTSHQAVITAHMKIQTLNYNAIRDETIAKLKHNFKLEFRCCTKPTLYLEPDAHPIFIRERPNVISAVDHSQWAAPLLVGRRPMDPSELRRLFDKTAAPAPPPVAEDVFTKLNGRAVFSQIDSPDASLQVEVDDDESKELLTINTHRGLYRYNRLSLGIKTPHGIFQQFIDSMISGLNDVAAYLDDVIVTGRTLAEHNANLKSLFTRISAHGSRVPIDECNFVMTQLPRKRYHRCRTPVRSIKDRHHQPDAK